MSVVIKRSLGFALGVLAYALCVASLVYFMGWILGVGVPVPIDAPPQLPMMPALGVDAGLLLAFALQHSIMARPAFKAGWTRWVPASLERSVYVLFSSVALLAVMRYWQPIGGVLWQVDSPVGRMAIIGVFAAGWVILFLSTFLINHFDLFGLRQVWLQLVGRSYTHLPFETPFLYRWVRHPLYVGWLLIFWAAPTMTVAHAVLAMGWTAYILIAIRFEERDLLRMHGEYQQYRERVPMLLPRLSR